MRIGRGESRIEGLSRDVALLFVPFLLLLVVPSAWGAVVLPGDPSWLGNTTNSNSSAGGDGTPNDYTPYLPLSYILLGSEGVAVVRVILNASTTTECPNLILASATATDNSSNSTSGNTTNSTYIANTSNTTTTTTTTNNSTIQSSATNNTTNFTIPTVQTRAVGDYRMPYPFPIRVCDLRLETLEQKRAWNNGEFSLQGISTRITAVKIPEDPQRYLFLSDTGLRSRPYDLGLGGICNASTSAFELYGIPQCPVNFTQSQLDMSRVRVDAQGFDEWPLQAMMIKAAQQQPDVVVFAGGALYRQGPCPEASGVDCVGLNSGGYSYSYSNAAQVQDVLVDSNGNAVVANFLPGHWGDNWFGWFSDFLFPALPLLQTAPWVIAPGDSESASSYSCSSTSSSNAGAGAASRGFFLLLSTEQYEDHNNSSNYTDTTITGGATTSTARAGDYCQQYMEPFSVPFANEQILVMDSGRQQSANEEDTVDAMSGDCFKRLNEIGQQVVPLAQNRFQDPTEVKEIIDADIARFEGYWDKLKTLSTSHETNFLVGHRPILGVYCNQSQLYTSDWTLQVSLLEDTLDRVSGIISGHQHVLEVLEFEKQALPTQITVGHGGTKFQEDEITLDVFPDLKLQVGYDGVNSVMDGPVSRGFSTHAMHGFTLMERNDQGNYDFTLLSLDTVAGALVVLDFPLTIPKGPRALHVPVSDSPSDSPTTLPSAAKVGEYALSPSTDAPATAAPSAGTINDSNTASPTTDVQNTQDKPSSNNIDTVNSAPTTSQAFQPPVLGTAIQLVVTVVTLLVQISGLA